ncbi:hypothetical protein [Microbispora sp. ATCC PTA-5024]|uniref:hypothetical protein n=1 Tax=Microbispora sp. ATCC PTA-5024 TaxID=316330 RepID=UPI0003DCD792|nr:hypothetical protein [Microbispora sp. ATCC PTA-5024]ETK35347.1 hypothetical protein MPTA5024_14735 [Microbispora sp. ATCC PTA-5024]
MLRPIILGLAALTGAASIASPAGAATAGTTAGTTAATAKVLYGFAWADGPHTLRITPLAPHLVKSGHVPTYTFSPIPGAKERRVDYSGADFRRVTSACDLKETEGVVKVDGKGLGRTRCTASELAFVLQLGPAPVRISLGSKVLVQEVLAPATKTKTATGTIKRVNDHAVTFSQGGKTVKLGYTSLSFNRVTKRCDDRWLANRAHVSHSGLGTKACDETSFTKALKSAAKPVRAKVYYDSLRGSLMEAWEVTAA